VTIEDLIRLAALTGGATSPSEYASARGILPDVPPVMGPPAPPPLRPMATAPAAPLAPSRTVTEADVLRLPEALRAAASGGIGTTVQTPLGVPAARGAPVPEDVSGMGPAGPLERIAAATPGNPILGLLDLAGTVLRGGHSAYRDAERRAKVNADFEKALTQHAETRETGYETAPGQALARLNAERDRMVYEQRRTQLVNSITAAENDLNGLQEKAATSQTPEELASYKNLYTERSGRLKRLKSDLARLDAGIGGAYSARATGAPSTADGSPSFPSKPPRPPKDGGLLGNGDLSEEGLNYVADYLNQTGILLPMGMGNQGTRAKVFNRAAQRLKAAGGDLGTNAAANKSDRESLGAMQKQYDAVTAFEGTALKNAKVLISKMEKIQDTGSPFFNAPIRTLSKKGAGSAEQAAYETALNVVVPEFAKILGNPGLSGQLTDSQRQEIQRVINKDATLNQMRAIIDVLTTDAENRRESYRDQLGEIRERIRTRGAGSDLPPGAVKVTP